jgi:hypothetical protein
MEAVKLTRKQVMRYATDQLHAVRPQPAGIPDMLAALDNALIDAEISAATVDEEEPPKDVKEAISRIDAAVGKMEHPPKQKPDLSKMAGTEVSSEGQGLSPAQEPKPKKVP